MTKRRLQVLRVLIPLLLFLLGCDSGGPAAAPTVTYDDAYLAVLGEATRLAPGSDASFLVQVRDPYDAEAPVQADTEVSVRLLRAEDISSDNSSEEVFAGRTDSNGIVDVRFPVSTDLESGDYQMMIEATVNRQRRPWE